MSRICRSAGEIKVHEEFAARGIPRREIILDELGNARVAVGVDFAGDAVRVVKTRPALIAEGVQAVVARWSGTAASPL